MVINVLRENVVLGIIVLREARQIFCKVLLFCAKCEKIYRQYCFARIGYCCDQSAKNMFWGSIVMSEAPKKFLGSIVLREERIFFRQYCFAQSAKFFFYVFFANLIKDFYQFFQSHVNQIFWNNPWSLDPNFHFLCEGFLYKLNKFVLKLILNILEDHYLDNLQHL